jgi:hypothetical protein
MTTTISGTSGVTYPSGGVDNTSSAGVGINDTQTLTNKTLTTPNINSAQIATVSGTAPLYMARAWVNFDGTTASPSTIRGSGNVSSVTKNGTGDYSVNFTTSMPDVNYSVAAQSKEFDSTTASNVLPIMAKQTLANTFSTSFVRINTYTTPVTTNIDPVAVTVAIFR